MPSPRSLPRALVRSAAGSAAPVLVLALLATLLAFVAPAPAYAGPAATSVASGAQSAPATGQSRPGTRQQAVRRTQQEEATPLSVTIGSLTPGTVPQRGPLTVTGTVTNTESEAWENVRVYPFLGDTPMTSSAELAEAAATDPSAYVGDRITDEGTYATLPRIDAGATVSFQLTVPQALLPESEGVYWFGAHALGDNDDPALGPRADGRARTFLTKVDRPNARDAVETAFVIPLRRRVVRAADGRVAQLAAWTRTLSSGGRLRELVDTGLTAGDRPIDWLVDPAVLDAVRQLAEGNPPRDYVPPEDPQGGENTSGSPSPEATSSEDPSQSLQPEDPEEAAAQAQAAEAASDWLDRFDSARAGTEVLALPYGDPDLPSVAAHQGDIYDLARDRSEALLAEWGISATPVDAPLGGYADQDALELGTSETPVILTDRAFSTSFGSTVPAAVSAEGRRVLTSSSGAAAGGPSPEPTDTGVALRQRIIAEAAIRAITAERGDDPVQPLLVSMPSTWDPEESTGLFDGLEQPWLNLRTVTGALALLPAETTPGEPAYPDSQAEKELPGQRIADAVDLDEAGQTLQRVLSRNDQVAARVRNEALTGTSYQSRGKKGRPTQRSLEHIETEFDSITLSAGRVTLSSSTGSFPVSVTNDLDQPVQVSLKPVSDQGISVTQPDPVEVPARGRTTVLLDAHAERNGLHTVSVVLTDSEGTALGSETTVTIRAAEVSAVIWVFIAVGATLLFVAIGIRLVRRIRSRGSDRDDPDASDESDETEHPRPEGQV